MASAKGIKMGEGHVSVGADTDPLNKGLEDAKEMFAEWGSKIAAVGASMTAVGALIAAPFLYGLSVLNEWGDETQRVMRQTNMSFAEVDLLLDGLRGNMLEGVSGQTVVAGLATMNKFILGAADGAQAARSALSQMGLSVEGLRSMSDSERLMAFADGLERIEDRGRRSAIAMEIFGRRNVFAMNLTGGSAGIRERSARVEMLQGQSMHSTDALNASREVIAAQNEMKLATQGFWASLGLAAAPVMRDFYQLMTKVIIAVRRWTEENRPLLTIIFYVADKLILTGTAIGLVGTAIYAVSYAFAFMQGAIAITRAVMASFTLLAAGGFGTLTALSWAWGTATFSASVAATGGLAIYKVGLMTLTAFSWLYSTAAAGVAFAYGLVTGATGLATVATGGYTLALVAAWIWENIASLGIVLLITALGALVVAIGSVVIALGGFVAFGFAVAFLPAAIAAIAASFGSLFESIGNSGWFVNLSAMFGAVVSTAQTAWAGIRDAFSVGDWGMIWEILKVTAMIEWEHISAYLIGVLNHWMDAIQDTFANVWLGVKTTFISMWAEVQRMVFSGLAAMARAIADITPDAEYANALQAYARIFDAQSEGTGLDARREIGNAIRDRNAEAATTQAARELRDAELAGAGEDRIRELQEELANLNQDAWIAAEQARIQGGLAGAIAATDAGSVAAVGQSSAGTFSRAAAAMFAGASSQSIAESPADIIRRQQLAVAEAMLRRLERQQGVVMA